MYVQGTVNAHRLTFESMGHHGIHLMESIWNLWLPMQWVPMVIHGNPSGSTHGWIPMGAHGSPWVPIARDLMDSIWIPWAPHMDSMNSKSSPFEPIGLKLFFVLGAALEAARNCGRFAAQPRMAAALIAAWQLSAPGFEDDALNDKDFAKPPPPLTSIHAHQILNVHKMSWFQCRVVF